jgi:molybdopterin synthase catalytic subunit
MRIVARLERASLEPASELSALLDEASGAGAVVSFVGVARPEHGRVQRLVLEDHPILTSRSLDEIAQAAAGRFDLTHVRVVHRCGEIGAGEPIVFAGAASPHRRSAFEATDYLMDRLKTDAVFWKREEGSGGTHWVEPTDADHRRRERWSGSCRASTTALSSSHCISRSSLCPTRGSRTPTRRGACWRSG